MNMRKDWDASYKLDIPLIDKAHEALFNAFNQFIVKAEKGLSADILAVSFRDLLKDVAIHFGEEEKLMQDMGYTCFESHKKIHDRLLHDADEVAHDLESANDEVDIVPYIECLHAIVVNHILDYDLMMGRFFHKKKKEE